MKDYSKTIETERLILRKFRLEDAEQMFKNYLSHEIVTKFLTWKAYKSLDEAVSFLNNIVLPAYSEENTYRWAIVLKSSGEVVGCIDVVEKNLRVKKAEIGYVIGDEFWGLGLMPEAAKAVVNYLFDEGFERIQAVHDVLNQKSGRVMQKIGMSFEGILRHYAMHGDGTIADCAMYAIIKK